MRKNWRENKNLKLAQAIVSINNMESVIREIETNCANVPDEFDFPFTPYPIQHEFMSKLYDVIEKRQFGIFESPTGTGKSLSIICGALRWLRDYNTRLHENFKQKIIKLENEANESSKDSAVVKDWFNAKTREIELTRMLYTLKLEYNKIQEYDAKIEKLKAEKETEEKKKMWKITDTKKSKEAHHDDDLQIESVDEDELILNDPNEHIEAQSDEDDEDADKKYEPIKIFICSRTHSQLSQFVGEVLKSPFGKDTRAVTLASRQNYCINPVVKKLKNVSLINERCLDMQRNKKKSNKADENGKVIKRQKGVSCCPFYKQQNIDYLKDSALLEVQDVEDLVSTSKEIGACPYYASRKAAEDAQVVLVPYNTLLHKATREANGIKLKNNIVIIDEAHNLLESLAQMYSSHVTHCQLYYAHLQLLGYKSKYSTRFSYNNLLCINQLIFVVKKLLSLFEKRPNKKDADTEVFVVQDFVLKAGIDNYNMFKLLKFCKDSKIAQKLHSFAVKFPDLGDKKPPPAAKGVKEFLASIQQNNKNKNAKQIVDVAPIEATKNEAPSNPLLAVISFLESLTYTYDDGRILVQRNENKSQSKLQFLLLNPAIHFKEIVKDARSVVVAGGTMKPNAEFRDRLFKVAGAAPARIVEFSCDHIIPPENILPIILTHGPQKQPLLFNFENRLSLGNALKLTIIEACKRIRGGIVVFFPSYKYESWFWQQVQETEFKRSVFREPQDSASVETVLKAYADTVKRSKGSALLFSVVGGKLSEGLNFSDDLGRCVIVVGLPYANIKSAELKEKMTYLDKKEGFGAGQKFYEGLCLKAVNQCIGRAVRHRNDYATMLLLDERYNRMATKAALPDWIKRSLKVCDYEQCFGLVDKFFREKKTT